MGLTERECWFWLCSRPYLGVKSIDKLLGILGQRGIFIMEETGQYSQVKGLKSTVLKQLQKAGEKDEEQIRKSMERLGALGGRFVCRADRDYPERLRHIYDAPAGLFYCGELPEPRRPMIGHWSVRGAPAAMAWPLPSILPLFYPGWDLELSAASPGELTGRPIRAPFGKERRRERHGGFSDAG